MTLPRGRHAGDQAVPVVPPDLGESATVSGARAPTRWFPRLRAVTETLILTMVIFFAVQTFVAQPYVVQLVSMEQTLHSDESVLVDKLTPRFDDYSRGDIVVFHPPETVDCSTATGSDTPLTSGTPYIKRVIGLPGDRVELRDGAVYVNAALLLEPYIWDGSGDPVATDPQCLPPALTVPPDALFVMGDHRGASSDSRTFGPITRGSVIGRAVLRYWPLEKLSILQTATYHDGPAPASGSGTPASRGAGVEATEGRDVFEATTREPDKVLHA